MKNILLTGYYGFGNTGDEAVLQEIIKSLRQVIPSVYITVLSHSPRETAAAYNVNAINRWKISQLWKALRRHDLLVLGGGSLLQDVTGNKSLLFYLGQIILARLAGRKVFLYAQGIGPINKPRNRRFAAFVLKGCTCITLRDEESLNFLKQLGIKEEKLFLTVDPVLSMEEEDLPPPLPIGKKLGICIRPWPGLDTSAFAKTADALSQAGWKIVFLPFQEPVDREIAREIANKMQEPYYMTEELFSPGVMYSAIGCMQGLIGMRLHSLIMAAAAGVPFTAISYDPKISAFCQSLGIKPAGDCRNVSPQQIVASVSAMEMQKESFIQSLESKKASWQRLGFANSILVREYAFGAKSFTLNEALEAIDKEQNTMVRMG